MNTYPLAQDYVTTHQADVAADIRSSRRLARHGPLHRLQRAVAGSLVLLGALMLPETPAVVAGRVFVLAPIEPPQEELQPAA